LDFTQPARVDITESERDNDFPGRELYQKLFT